MRTHAFFIAALMLVLGGGQTVFGDLILHYTGDNTAADSSGFGNHGSLNNGTSYAPGVLNSAFSFDGINDIVAGPVVAQINPTQFSIAMWVNAQPESGLRLLADSSHGGTRNGNINWEGFAVQLTSSNQIDFTYGNGSTFPHVTTNAIVADNTFHHFAATFDGTTMSVYVDGNLDNTATYSGTPLASGRAFRLGNHDQITNRAYLGLLDDVRVYNETLSASQVASLASVPEPTSAGVLFGAFGLILVRRRMKR